MKSILIAIALLICCACKTTPNESATNNKKMKTLIVYASNHGTTEKVATIIREKLDSTTTEMVNLKKESKIDLSNYQTVIIGGSIHAGSIQAEVKKFIKTNTITLVDKRIALFLCCMNEKDEKKEFDENYPELLRSRSVYNAIVGGEYIFEKMNFVEKLLVKKIAGITTTTSKLRFNEIDNLVKAVIQ